MKRSAAVVGRILMIAFLGACSLPPVWGTTPKEPPPAADGLAAQIVEMTGARTRLVWQHQVAVTPGNNWDATTAEYELVVYDTADGKQRVMLPGPANYSNPCFTADGSRIVFTDAPNNKAYIIDWDGRNKRLLFNGYAFETWIDPKTGTDWVYANSDGKVIRFQLDNPELTELVWDKTKVASRFRVSADGTRGAGEFHWPNLGVAMLPNVSWKQYGYGCNAAIAPDNSYRLFHMGEAAGHAGVMMYDGGGVNKRLIRFDNVPGKEGQNSWVPRWTNDVRFLTLACPISGQSQELYLGEFDENFTTVKRWIQITNQTGQDVYGDAWIDPGLGYHTGEVPLTVEIPAPDTQGKWKWDYGDGKREKGIVGRRTYTRPGQYRMTARRGGKVVKGSVRAYPAKPPGVTGIRLFDETSLSVMFDEQVQLKNAKVSLASGAAVKSWDLDPEGLSLLVKLEDNLPEGDSLRIEGVYDRAQAPNALARRTFPIERPAWPSNRSGLVFLWQSNNAPSFQWHPSSGSFNDTQLDSWQRRSFDRFGAMSLEGGVFFALDGGLGIYSECTKANRFSVEAVITPANRYQGWRDEPRWIVACNTGGRTESVNVMIAQEGGKAVLYFKQRPVDNPRARPSVKRIELCTMIDRAPNHIIAGYEPGNLTCYLNGKLVARNTEVKGVLSWREPSFGTGMSFGGSQVVTNDIPFRKEFELPWRGKIEGVAVYTRALTAEEAAANFAAYDAILKARPTAPRITLRGKLLAKSTVPNPKDIAPYRDAMVVQEYKVEKILKSTYAPKKIRVARWGLVDARPSAVAREKPGESVMLVVEPFADHLQLEAEVRQNTLDEDFDLELYYDIANGPTDAPYLAAVRVRPREIWIPPNEKMQYRVLTRDQYGNPIKAPVRWSVLPGGYINTGMFYSGGAYLEHLRDKGTGSITDTGLFTADGNMGIVTIQAASTADPSVKGTAGAAVDEYPAITPCGMAQLHFGGDGNGKRPFTGDIDRIRIYNRALSAEQIAAHAEGKALTNEGLVGDWKFDKFDNGLFVNSAGGGMAGKVVGTVQHVPDGDGGHIRMPGPWGYVEVKHDNRLNFSQTATLEAWIRPTGNGGIVMDKSLTGAIFGFRLDSAGGLRAKGMHGWLELGHRHPVETWTHLVATFQRSGVWKGYVNGKLIGERKRRVIIVRQ